MTYTYNYDVSGIDSSIFGAAMLGYLAVLLVVYILVVIAMWKVFTKAGKPGWASLIPVYNSNVSNSRIKSMVIIALFNSICKLDSCTCTFYNVKR